MIPEIGNFFLVFSMINSLLLVATAFVLPSVSERFFLLASLVSFSALLLSFVALEISFLTDDFSVLYVASNSNPNLPIYFKFAALWGGHEGSLLLFLLILSAWILTFVIFHNDHRYSSAFMNVVLFALLAFTVFLSNPFERLLPISSMSGSDLNPLLQDFAFTIHPPMLYMGYAGLVIPFGIGMSFLLNQKSIKQLEPIRSWSVVSWAFLTLGISLGSWWAYYELGWGGWWFWDPVENSALIPWLLCTALIHSSVATNSRQIFINWTLSLTILSLAGSLLGMFLVRSGIITSVHSFALDPDRGIFLLFICFLIIILGFSLFFLKSFKRDSKIEMSIYSREFMFFMNNAFLVALSGIVLLGTIYPIIYEIFSGGDQITVGAPYFNMVTVPFALVLLFFQAMGPLTKWGGKKIDSMKTILMIVFSSIFLSFLISEIFFSFSFYEFIGNIIVLILIQSLILLISKSFSSGNKTNLSMILGHLGIAILTFGITVSSLNSIEKEFILKKNESVSLGSSTITLEQTQTVKEDNYYGDRVTFTYQEKDRILKLYPERRFYPASRMETSEAGISPSIYKDVYISLGQKISENTWAAKVQIKPLVRLIWLGAIIMFLAGLFARIRVKLR
tara:strand:+ start:173 stop:2032 length:1860 start_codon:yes stop_codon:yes gene_type:complete